jgi:aminomethyltransferase
MGYVATELATIDSIVYIQVRDKQLKAKVVKVPFN